MEECGTGLEVVNVVLESIHPPMEIAPVYQDIISVGIEAESWILNAETNALLMVNQAKKTAIAVVSAAKVRQEEEIVKAHSAVETFMAAVEADETYGDFYRDLKRTQAMMQYYKGLKLIFVGDGIKIVPVEDTLRFTYDDLPLP